MRVKAKSPAVGSRWVAAECEALNMNSQAVSNMVWALATLDLTQRATCATCSAQPLSAGPPV
jgi:hypothetical protein